MVSTRYKPKTPTNRTRHNQGSPRNFLVQVYMNKDELEVIDRKRRGLPRSVYLRQCALEFPDFRFKASAVKAGD